MLSKNIYKENFMKNKKNNNKSTITISDFLKKVIALKKKIDKN